MCFSNLNFGKCLSVLPMWWIGGLSRIPDYHAAYWWVYRWRKAHGNLKDRKMGLKNVALKRCFQNSLVVNTSASPALWCKSPSDLGASLRPLLKPPFVIANLKDINKKMAITVVVRCIKCLTRKKYCERAVGSCKDGVVFIPITHSSLEMRKLASIVRISTARAV